MRNLEVYNLLMKAYKKAGSREQLAKNIGVCTASIGRWFRGDHVPRIEQILKLQDYITDENQGEIDSRSKTVSRVRKNTK